MLFYYDFFKVGLRLSMDPFIVEFLNEANAAPVDLILMTMRILGTFAIAWRLLRFEPYLILLRKLVLFSIDTSSGRIGAPAKPRATKLFSAFTN